MVDKADMVIAVWNGSPSGTGKTVAYAKEQGKPVLMIDPESYDVHHRIILNQKMQRRYQDGWV